MTKFDRDYLELCKKILKEGTEVENRTGIHTIKIPSYSFEFNLKDEFPILQSKQSFYRNAIIEILWIWQMQSNDVRELHNRGVHIWDEWMIDDDGIYRIYEQGSDTSDYDPEKAVPVTTNCIVDEKNLYGEKIPLHDASGNSVMAKSRIDGKNIKEAIYFGKENAYTIGTAYGFITNRYQHMQNLINTIKNNPNDRRMVKSLWQDEFIRTAVLPSCVWSTEWDVTGDKLNLLVHQRSCDVPLGLPFNVTQYATLLSMVAQVTGLEPGIIQHSIKDAHIYVNQIKGIEEQLRRYNEYEKLNSMDKDSLLREYQNLKNYLEKIRDKDVDSKINDIETRLKIMDLIIDKEKPELVLNPDIKDFFMFDNSRELKDIKVKKYKHAGRISFKIAQ